MIGRASARAMRSAVASIEVLGEGIRTAVPIPDGGATVRDLLRAAGVSVRDGEWDIFEGANRVTVDHRVNEGEDTALSLVPRTAAA